jgi:hypothetical protein
MLELCSHSNKQQADEIVRVELLRESISAEDSKAFVCERRSIPPQLSVLCFRVDQQQADEMSSSRVAPRGDLLRDAISTESSEGLVSNHRGALLGHRLGVSSNQRLCRRIRSTSVLCHVYMSGEIIGFKVNSAKADEILQDCLSLSYIIQSLASECTCSPSSR